MCGLGKGSSNENEELKKKPRERESRIRMIQTEKQKAFVTHCRNECWKQRINQVVEIESIMKSGKEG